MAHKKVQTLSALKLEFGTYSDLETSSRIKVAFDACLPSDPEALRFKGAVLCIARGINSGKGVLASQIACRGFIADYYATPDYWTVKQSAYVVIDAINTWLHHQDRNSFDSSGFVREDTHITTFSVLIIKSTTAHIFHVGDNRIFRFERAQLHQLTKDHILHQSGSAAQLTRALGIEDTVDIDYLTVPLIPGDQFLLSTAGANSTPWINKSLFTGELQGLYQSGNGDLNSLARAIFEVSYPDDRLNSAAILIVDIVSLPTEKADEALQKYLARSIPPKLEIGSRIDYFTIEKILASGSRSHVYLAISSLDDKRYVLKMPSRDQKDDTEYLQGFVLEQWISLKLRHPTLMAMYEPPETSQFLYHVSEFIEGITLRQWMTEHPLIKLADARAMLHELIKPVRYLHRNNLLHRDLKPENFIIRNDGVVKLIDFGTVKVPSVQELSDTFKKENPLGDIRYIAPEVLIFGTSSNRSDLFSIACIIYEMLTRELPYAAILTNQDLPRQFDLWIYRSINKSGQSIQRPPPWVDQVLQKALAPDPRNRYEMLSEFEADLLSPTKEITQSATSLPLAERNPAVFWKVVSLVLVTMLLAQTIYLALGL